MKEENVHVMLDLETLGTRPGDAILSIGAAIIDPGNGIKSTFYVTIDSESCKAAGLRAQKSTLEWWAKQSAEARAAAFKGELSLQSGLTQFSMWIPKGNVLVWGNGAGFDQPLLEAAYRAMKMDIPWKFWNARCYRTIKSMFPVEERAREGVHHNALSDAMHQAFVLQDIVKAHNLKLA